MGLACPGVASPKYWGLGCGGFKGFHRYHISLRHPKLKLSKLREHLLLWFTIELSRLMRNLGIRVLYFSYHFSVCSPVGSHCDSREDYSLIERKGLAVMDCSWACLGDLPPVKLRCASPCLCTEIHSLKIMSSGRIWFHGHYYQLYHKWLYIFLLFIFYIFTSWQWCIYLSWIHHLSLTKKNFLLGTSLWNWRKIVLNCSTIAGCSKSSKLWSTSLAILRRGIISSFNNMVQLSSETLYGINFHATIFV